ncbi:MAG: TIM barrel protein [Methanomicrobiaceae archaeon]|nr:TIM barrel protein [Methanomicrobiaceae archaeon]
MKYKELMNFSIYEYDLKKFDNDWNNLRNLLKNHELDGIELLVNFEEVPDKIPADIINSVHLPSFMGWYRLWEDENFRVPEEIPDESVKYFYGGHSREEIVSNFCDCLVYASVLEPAYGVFHAAYTEIGTAFQNIQPYSDNEILEGTAEFLNEVASRFPGGEPPFEIYIENLWYPGLTFLDPDAALEFIDKLEFKKWKLLLDTGHLMNATCSCNEEENAIDKVLELLEKVDKKIIERIGSIHLHLSTSGDYQNEMKEPENYRTMTLDEKYSCIYELLKNVDQHRPFSSERCREIVDFISPEFVTHELPGMTAEEIEDNIRWQTKALRY